MILAITISSWFRARDTRNIANLREISTLLADEYGLEFGISPA
jgi:hypothetical protein